MGKYSTSFGTKELFNTLQGLNEDIDSMPTRLEVCSDANILYTVVQLQLDKCHHSMQISEEEKRLFSFFKSFKGV